jgi:hypothetical protein
MRRSSGIIRLFVRFVLAFSIGSCSVILILLLATFFRGFQEPSFESECKPNDQDRYVYRPSRLRVISECVRVTGTVKAIYLPGREDDGDVGINSQSIHLRRC